MRPNASFDPDATGILSQKQLDAIASIHGLFLKHQDKGERCLMAFGAMCAKHAVIPNLLAHAAALTARLERSEKEKAEAKKLIQLIDVIATDDDADEDKECLALIKSHTTQFLSDLSL